MIKLKEKVASNNRTVNWYSGLFQQFQDINILFFNIDHF